MGGVWGGFIGGVWGMDYRKCLRRVKVRFWYGLMGRYLGRVYRKLFA